MNVFYSRITLLLVWESVLVKEHKIAGFWGLFVCFFQQLNIGNLIRLLAKVFYFILEYR